MSGHADESCPRRPTLLLTQGTQALVTFAVTNVDDIVLLALWFALAGRRRSAAVRIVTGQYLGFVAILVVCLLAALGVGLLPAGVAPYLGLVPLLIGLRGAWTVWRERRDGEDDSDDETERPDRAPGALQVAAITFANGGDNFGVYVPLFTAVGVPGQITYCAVFLVLVGVWNAAGLFLATRAPVARAVARRGEVLLPVVLIAIGVAILVEGGAFGIGG